MEITNTPSVFKNFTAANNTQTAKDSAASNNTDNQNGAKNILNKEETEFKKGVKNYPIAKGILALIGLGVAFTYLIPFIRHNVYTEVNPSLIDINAKNGLAKRNFIVFADQVEIKRKKTAEFISERFSKAKECIRRNFFSYNQSQPEKFAPIKDTPKNFVRGIIGEINAFCNHISAMQKRIPIDYEKFNRK